MSRLVELEPMTDDCIKILERKFDNNQGESIDLGLWLHWFAFDVITSITFSTQLGFMEKEKDISGIINALEGRLVYNSIIGEIPAAHKILLGNSFTSSLANLFPTFARLNSSRYIVEFAAKQLQRYRLESESSADRCDLLSRFKRSRDGEVIMTDKDLLGHASTNM